MPPTWLPEAAALAKLIAGQTIGAREDSTANAGNFGKVTGSFPTSNVPLANAALALAYKKPARLVGDTDDENLTDLAADATLMKAAAHYVSQVYSDQVTDGQRSRAEEYWSRQYDEAIAELQAAVDAVAGGDEPGADDNVGSGSVVGFFRPSKLVDCYGRPRIV